MPIVLDNILFINVRGNLIRAASLEITRENIKINKLILTLITLKCLPFCMENIDNLANLLNVFSSSENTIFEEKRRWDILPASLCTQQEEIINLVFSVSNQFLTTFHKYKYLEENKLIHM